MYAYDDHGWYTGAGAGDRSTNVAPPACGNAPAVGQPWPNFSGTHGAEWSMVSYVAPPTGSPAPNLGTVITSRAFMLRLESVGILTAFYAAAKQSPALESYKDLVLSGPTVDLADPLTIDKLGELVPLVGTADQVQTVLTAPVTAKELR